jgi:hypothetical protein
MRTSRTQALKMGAASAKLQEGEHCAACGGPPMPGETQHQNHYEGAKLSVEGGNIPVADVKISK